MATYSPTQVELAAARSIALKCLRDQRACVETFNSSAINFWWGIDTERKLAESIESARPYPGQDDEEFAKQIAAYESLVRRLIMSGGAFITASLAMGFELLIVINQFVDVVTEQIREHILVATADRDRPIIVCGTKESTAHDAAQYVAKRLMYILSDNQKHLQSEGVEGYIAAVQQDLAEHKIDYDGLAAEIDIEFGRAVQKLSGDVTPETLTVVEAARELNRDRGTINRRLKGPKEKNPFDGACWQDPKTKQWAILKSRVEQVRDSMQVATPDDSGAEGRAIV